MSLTNNQIKHIQELAIEGMEPGLIHSKYYPKVNRQDINKAYYTFVKYSPKGACISIGQIIAILRISATDKDKLLLDRLYPLINQLYKTLRSNQQKLDETRKPLS
ncbi:hypothetical protein ES705_24651 [subsurface metagenome]